MSEQGDDKELMAAFAEFKELLRRDAGQPGDAPSAAPEVSLAPEVGVSAETVSPAVAPILHVSELGADSAAPVFSYPQDANDAWSAAPSPDEALYLSEAPTGSRRKLIYLSVAIVIAASRVWPIRSPHGASPLTSPPLRTSRRRPRRRPRTRGRRRRREEPAADPAKDAAAPVDAATAPAAESAALRIRKPPPLRRRPLRLRQPQSRCLL